MRDDALVEAAAHGTRRLAARRDVRPKPLHHPSTPGDGDGEARVDARDDLAVVREEVHDRVRLALLAADEADLPRFATTAL